MKKFKNNFRNIFKTTIGRLMLFIAFVLIVVSFVFLVKGFAQNKSKSDGSKKIVVENQMGLPQKGDRIAILTVGEGEQGEKELGKIKIKLFQEAAPKTVERFVKLAKNGEYDGTKFDEIVSDLKIQCSGYNVPNIEKQEAVVECNESLHNYNGAVGAVRVTDDSGKDVGQTGQFYINFSGDGYRANFEYLQNHPIDYSEGKGGPSQYFYPEDVRQNYKKFGGYPVFDITKCNIFGQVYSGMDVVEKIANCPKTSESVFEDPHPVNSIVIKKVEIQIF